MIPPIRIKTTFLASQAHQRRQERHQPKGMITCSVADQHGVAATGHSPITTEELILRAKHNIGLGETSRIVSFRAAVEDIALACDQGATQREIAEGVGKSPAWVNRLMKWREGGYVGAPFADKFVQGVNGSAAPVEPAAAKTTSERENSAEQHTNGGGPTMTNAAEPEDIAVAAEEQAVANKFSCVERARLIETLEFLAVERPRLRAKFALIVENRRAGLGLTWDQLLISADEVAPSVVVA